MGQKSMFPHDRLMRSAMEYPAVMRELMAHHLPSDLGAALDLETVVSEKDSCVDGSLQIEIPDFLLSCQRKETAEGAEASRLYVVVEHVSQADRLMALRMHRYQSGVMGMVVKRLEPVKGLQFPLVIPLVVYTGSRPFRDALSILDLFTDREEAALFWGGAYMLLDVSLMTDERLLSYLWLGPVLLALKYGPVWRKQGFRGTVDSMVQSLRMLESAGMDAYIKVILVYMAEVVSAAGREDFMDEVVSHVMGRDKVKTIMDCFHEEGMLRGRLEGLQEGELKGLQEGELKGLQAGKLEGERKALQNVALSLVSEGMDTDQVARLTGLKASDVMDLRHRDADSLMC